MPQSGLCTFVFSPRRHAAADVPLGFVAVEQLPHLLIERGVDLLQPLREILVDGRFGDAELFGGGADGGVVGKKIFREIACACFHVHVH